MKKDVVNDEMKRVTRDWYLSRYSETSLKDMRTFYEEWNAIINRQPVADDLHYLCS